MNPSFYILVIEDEPEVAEAVADSLAPLEDTFQVEVAASAEDARELISNYRDRGLQPGLILCDHVLPGMQGVDFLIELQKTPETAKAKKVLLTGQAGLEATIQAVNRANLDHYIAKPWNDQELVDVSRRLLTDYLLSSNEDPVPFLGVLDSVRIAEAMRLQSTDR